MARISEWLAARRSRPQSDRFVARLMSDPDEADVKWLARVATDGDEDRARWELRYARRAFGLLVAQRDALNDRVASVVGKGLASAMAADRNVAASMVQVAKRQFNERLTTYREIMALRTAKGSISERLGRALLLLSGAPRVGGEDVNASGRLVERLMGEANEWLRESFGTVKLPEDVPPSALAG